MYSVISVNIVINVTNINNIYQQNFSLGKRYYISVTEHHLLNRPEQPCEVKEDYDFLECVKSSQAKSVGCRPPWDIWSPESIPLCQTVVQLQQHERLDWLDINYEQKMIINNTGCLVPCKYKVEQYFKIFQNIF